MMKKRTLKIYFYIFILLALLLIFIFFYLNKTILYSPISLELKAISPVNNYISNDTGISFLCNVPDTSSLLSIRLNIFNSTGNKMASTHQRNIQTYSFGTNSLPTWYKSFFNERYYTIVENFAIDNQKNIYVTGINMDKGWGYRTVLLLKYDLNGNLLWNKTFWDKWDNAGATDIVIDSSNNLYVVGHTLTPNRGYLDDFLILKFDSEGSLLWDKKFGSRDELEGATKIVLDETNNLNSPYF